METGAKVGMVQSNVEAGALARPRVGNRRVCAAGGAIVEMTLAQRFWAYFYSRPNLVGLALAIFGGVLLYYGLLPRFGLLIVLALYLIGVLVTPRNKQMELDWRRKVTEAEIREELEKVARTTRRRAPREIYLKVDSIKDSILSILPQLMLLGEGDRSLYTIRQTALEYLPQALQNYFNLPAQFANFYPLRNGKTARQLLGDQLDILDREMKAIVADYAVNDMQKLLAHGRFLEQKFQQDELFTRTKAKEKEPVQVRR